MIVEVLKFFMYFVQNIPPKLLFTPEIILYLQKLILLSYELDVEDNHNLKQGLVKLIHVVCRQMINQQELIDLYFERSKSVSNIILFILIEFRKLLRKMILLILFFLFRYK